MAGAGDDVVSERLPRVLVVDDNRDAADTLALLLERWGFEVRAVYTGSGVIAAARDFRPDCMLLDIGLPGVDGYRLARQVRQDELLKGATMIAISAYSESAKSKEAGFDEHLVKPADLTNLQAMLRKLQIMRKRLEKTEEIVQQQAAVVTEARDLMKEVKHDMKEMKQELREVKEDVREIKEELREVKEDPRGPVS